MSAYLRYVVVWPWTGDFNTSWTYGAPPKHPAHDAFLRIMRRVSESYSIALIPLRIPNGTSEVRLIVRDVHRHDDVTVSALEQPMPWDSFEMVDVVLPSTFAEATGQAQAETGLEVIHAAVTSLAAFRGWPLDALTRARQETEDRGIACSYATPWKASPGREFKARVEAWIADDGFVWSRLAVIDRDQRRIAETDDQITWGHMLRDMRRFQHDVRWTAPLTVKFDRPLGRGSTLSLTIDPDNGDGHIARVDCDAPLRATPSATRSTAFPVKPLVNHSPLG